MNIKLAFTLFITTFLALPALGEEVLEVTFNDIPTTACDDIWVQSGVNIEVTSTTAEDCDGGGNCSWIVWNEDGGVGMAPARLTLDLVESYQIYRVEFDIIDYCGTGCTRAFLYNNGVQVGSTANTTSGIEETMVVVPLAGGMVDSIAISSCEGVVLGQTIRIVSEVVGTEPSSWGRIKGQFR